MATVTVLRHDKAVTELQLSRPEALNAISSQLARELVEATTSLANDADVRVVVLSAAGDRAFPDTSSAQSGCPRFTQRNDGVYARGGQTYDPATGFGWVTTYFYFKPDVQAVVEYYNDYGVTNPLRIDSDGNVAVPQAPGFGLEIDWELLERTKVLEL